MLKELKTIKEKVNWILKEYPKTRNDDKNLFIIYTCVFHEPLLEKDGMIKLENIYNLPSFESIRRSRQLIQRNAYTKVLRGDDSYRKYLPDDKTVLKRRKMENVYMRFVK